MVKPVETVVMAVGTFTLLLAGYLVAIQAGHKPMQPDYENERKDPFIGLNAHVFLTCHSGENQTQGHEWRRSDFDPTNESLVTLPVRYPARSGQNINAILHHGWSSLTRPASSDGDWIERPPGEVMW